jgi:hypothetical protein
MPNLLQKSTHIYSILIRGAYFLKNKSETPFYRRFGQVIYCFLGFSGQQYSKIFILEYERERFGKIKLTVGKLRGSGQ